jgi:hypothetical protein
VTDDFNSYLALVASCSQFLQFFLLLAGCCGSFFPAFYYEGNRREQILQVCLPMSQRRDSRIFINPAMRNQLPDVTSGMKHFILNFSNYNNGIIPTETTNESNSHDFNLHWKYPSSFI